MDSLNTTLNHTHHHHYHNPSLDSLEIALWFRILIGTLLAFTFIFGTAGNIYLIICTCGERKNIRSIHVYTLNLAVSALLVLLIYLPMIWYHQIYMLMRWNMGLIACRFLYWTNASTVNANICTLIAVTNDRYHAVTNPLVSRSRGLSRVKTTVCCIWIISLLLSAPLFAIVDVRQETCAEHWASAVYEQVYWISMFSLQLVLPIIYFTVSYSIIAYHLRVDKIPDDSPKYVLDETILLHNPVGRKRRREPPKAQTLNAMSVKRKKQQDKMIKLAVFLVTAYLLCVSPQHAVFFAHIYGGLMETHDHNVIYIFIASNFLMVFNSFINPIVFITQSRKMRLLLRKLFQEGICCSKHLTVTIAFKRQAALRAKDTSVELDWSKHASSALIRQIISMELLEY